MTKTSIYRCCYLKLELNGLEGGGGLDAPDATVFGDLHNLNQNHYWGLIKLMPCMIFVTRMS